MTYLEAMEYIHGVYWRGSKLGLQRITELLSLMGDPQDGLEFVHVAGTNGKGSVCAMLASVLGEQGYRTGLYTSPYIEVFNERIQVNGRPISDENLSAVTEYVRGFAESMADLPTEFEIVCAIAFEYFKRERCDIVVLEVGLGGLLDATNVIKKPLVSVITAIDFDHMEHLGATISEIAAQKCGIIKSQTAVVSYEQTPEARSVIEAKCTETQSPLLFCDFGTLKSVKDSLDGQRFSYRDFDDLGLKMLGSYQQKNAALVVDVLTALNGKGFEISDKALRSGLEKAVWPARFEVLCSDPLFVLDGAHNVHGACAVVAAARRYFGEKKAVVLIGVLRDKEYDKMLEVVDDIASAYIAASPDSPRAVPARELAEFLGRFDKPIEVADNISDAVGMACKRAKAAAAPGLALGSLYMAGEIRKYFRDTENTN